MEVNKLRIGNFVKNKIDGTVFSISIIGEECEWDENFTIHGEIDGQDSENYDYVPLSIDWIELFGFIPENLGYFLPSGERTFVEFKDDTCSVRIRTDNESSVFVREIKYVHELQNIFSAIEEIELYIEE